ETIWLSVTCHHVADRPKSSGLERGLFHHHQGCEAPASSTSMRTDHASVRANSHRHPLRVTTASAGTRSTISRGRMSVSLRGPNDLPSVHDSPFATTMT